MDESLHDFIRELTRPAFFYDAPCSGMAYHHFFCDDGRRENRLPGLLVCNGFPLLGWKGCEVKQECLDYALRTSTNVGVFGGKSSAERRRIRRQLRLVTQTPQRSSA